MFKRIGLFLLTNILVVATISILMSVLGVQPYLTARGIDYKNLMIFCLIWGFAGSFISLALSRIMAKWMMGVKVIDPQNAGQYASLVNLIHRISQSAQLPAMPQVGVYESPDLNAFATGPTKSRSLVAVSTGLLQNMNPSQLEGVLAHEVSHIKNGDMVTMTLLQGIVNAFVMFISRSIAFAATQSVKDSARPLVRMLVTIVLDIALSALGMLLVAAYSRKREFYADAGSAQLVGRDKMISALQRLNEIHGKIQIPNEPKALAAFKISDNTGKTKFLFASHPPLEKRIEALQKNEFSA